jgi:hypothetical protein
MIVSIKQTTPDGSVYTDEMNCPVVEIEGSGSGPYNIIFTYPEYVMTPELLKDAVNDFLSISSVTALTDAQYADGPFPSGKWVYYDSAMEMTCFGNFTEAEFKTLESFWAKRGWETYASTHGVSPTTKFAKIKTTFKNSNSKFDMVNLVQVGSPEYNYTSDFPTLALLKAATLVEELEWDWSDYDPMDMSSAPTKGEVSVITFTR